MMILSWFIGVVLVIVGYVLLNTGAARPDVEEGLVVPPTLQTLREFESVRNWTPPSDTIVIGGTVYNCEPYLDAVFANIQRMVDLFPNYVIVIAVDEGTDRSMERLRDWQSRLPHVVILPDRRRSAIRTENLARARNRILDYIRAFAKTTPLTHFIMMDCDDVCAQPIHLPLLQHVWTRSSEWEAVTFPGVNNYYDTWALSVAPYVLSYRHFTAPQSTPPHERALTRMKNFILRELDRREWIPCASSFGGFGVYHVRPFLDCAYDSSFSRNLRFFTAAEIQANERACGSQLQAAPRSDEDCEHRFFHLSGVLRHRARMFIVPYALFPYSDSMR